MEILSDGFLRTLLETGGIAVSGSGERRVQPVSIDFSLGGLKTWDGVEIKPENRAYRLEPGKSYRFYTEETLVNKSNHIHVYIAQRSTLARALVDVMDTSDEYMQKIDGRFEGRLEGMIAPRWFPVEIKKGTGIEQAVFLVQSKSPVNIRTLESGAFMRPKKPNGYLDISDGVDESELFEEVEADQVWMDRGDILKVKTKEKVDYSDNKKAALAYASGIFYAPEKIKQLGLDGEARNSPIGLMTAMNGQPRVIDPGYNGLMTSIIPDSSIAKIVRKDSPVIRIHEYSLRGKVERPYGSKGMGSHYAGK